MPITKSAKKTLRQDGKKSLRNLKVKNEIKDLIKKSQRLIEKKNKDGAQEKMKAAIKAIDRAIKKKVLKKNAGARKKSRLMKKFNQSDKEKK